MTATGELANWPLPTMPRLFVAIRPPPAAARRLAAMRSDVSGARWLPAESLHMTLLFLGSVADAAPLMSALTTVTAPSHRVSLEVKRAFPAARNARVLVYAGDAVPELTALHLRVQSALAGHFKPEARPFRPHVTLARMKSADPAGVKRWLAEPARPIAFDVTEFVLFESRPGAVYEPLGVYPLG